MRKLNNHTQKKEFDPGSEWTLAICLTHASRTLLSLLRVEGRIRGRNPFLRAAQLSWACGLPSTVRTVENKVANGRVICGNLPNSLGQIPNERKLKGAVWWAHKASGSWLGKGWPSQRRLAGLLGRSAALGLRHGPDSHGRLQWGILDNGRKPDPAIWREWRRAMQLVKLFRRVCDYDKTRRRSPG